MRAVRTMAGVVLGAVCVALVAPVLPFVTGREVVVVDGGSMRPSYQPGDVLVLERTAVPPRVGEVVRVGAASGGYVHRVVAVDGDTLTLRGDANPLADPGVVDASEVRGVVAGRVGQPWAAVIVGMTSLSGRVALVLLAGACGVVLLGVRRASNAPAPEMGNVGTVRGR